MLKKELKILADEKRQKGVNTAIILNYLKEYIQYLVLSLIYNHKDYKNLIFTGGSCLRICYGLPRLSEDLDFDLSPKTDKKRFLNNLNSYLSKEIRGKYFPELETKIQSTIRLYLKFPMLRELGVSNQSESDKLYVKIEPGGKKDQDAGLAITPVSKYGYNFIARHYDLPTLMSGKINALLNRLWLKGKNDEIDIKGRDFYDLYWYLQNKIEPNWKLLKKKTGISNKKQLKNALKNKVIKSVTAKKLIYDLQNFIEGEQFVTDFAKNYINIINKLI